MLKQLDSWSPDGRFLVFNQLEPDTKADIWYVAVDGDHSAKPYLRTPFAEGGGQISSDGKWMAYISDETGRSEAYLQSFPAPGEKYRVTTDGANGLKWLDAHTLGFAKPADMHLCAIDVQFDGQPRFSTPRVAGTAPSGTVAADVTSDLKRALVSVPVQDVQPVGSIVVVSNWTTALRRLQ